MQVQDPANRQAWELFARIDEAASNRWPMAHQRDSDRRRDLTDAIEHVERDGSVRRGVKRCESFKNFSSFKAIRLTLRNVASKLFFAEMLTSMEISRFR